RYTRAKAGRGGAACAICGSAYRTRKPAETAVAFQPGVYTARIKIGGSDNKRSLCSICALEQLLRQLFVENLDTGGTAEGQRIRYLSFYPSYFFTPETLRLMRRVYGRIKAIRLGDRELRRVLEMSSDNPDKPMKHLDDPQFWQRLEPFLLRAPDEEPSRRVLRYAEETQPTFLTVGLRSFNDPTDTESWVLPALLALALSVCLDVKVVASESGVPLLVEADELPETIWLDSAHAAIRALVGDGAIHVDAIMPALVRLTAAYLIHLDTEGDPRDEHWNRFAPIANSLMESPLYVFYHLKRQERGDKRILPDQARRYIAYAELFAKVSSNGGNEMHRAKELVRLYSQFYWVKRPFQASSYTLLRPLDIVADTLLNADRRLFDDEESLIDVTRGQLHDRMESSETNAIFIRNRASEELMREFCTFFVHDIFLGVYKGDVAALRGKQLNLLRSACEVIYLDEVRRKWAARGQEADTDDELLTEAEPNN
ncbi:MAG: type I-D CRISPR-associated protein Cas10d/Csc3, partial [Anaerolineae bacterium]|nr:type I-D CRISPR-associated protein Cas10d/Csc3 [Anaerolineae bacterium]